VSTTIASRLGRGTIVVAALAAALAAAGPAGAQTPASPPSSANVAPVAGFSVGTAVPVVGQPITFTSTSMDIDGAIAAQRWDLNGDGRFTDASGPVATWVFTQAGSHVVRLRVRDDSGATATASVTLVVDQPPTAAFASGPAVVPAGGSATFVSTSRDPDGSIARLEWDLDGDNAFDDGGAATVTHTYPTPGVVVVQLRVTDDRGVTSVVSGIVTVVNESSLAPLPPGPPTPNLRPPGTASRPGAAFIAPFPVVRIRGRIARRVVTISLLSVRAPRGATVLVRCRGVGCPRAPLAAHMRSAGRALRLRMFEARYRPGARLEVFVTMPGRIGKYVRFEMRGTAAPARQDLCLGARGTKPIQCPTR
jgi:PKD repeat protein